MITCLLNFLGGRFYFREFLRSEYSEENMLFWLACEELKSEQQNPQIVEEKARLIYEDYISILSPREVSLDSRVREIINRNMVDPSPYTFDEAQLQIYTLMHRDSYPRFLNSPLYKKLISGDTRLWFVSLSLFIFILLSFFSLFFGSYKKKKKLFFLFSMF